MASTDARPIPQKNVACRITFPIFDADGDLVTGAASLDSEVSKDGGTFVDCTNEATEIATSSGIYFLDLTSTEMNADTVAVIVKTATAGAKTTALVLYPEEPGDIRVNATQWNSLTTVALPLVPTVAGRTLDVSATGEAGIDWANIGSPTTAQNLSATNIDVDQIVASVSGAIDPWATALPGAYGAGTAGKIVGDNVNATISSRATQTSVDTIDDFVDTEVAAIKAKTDNLPANPAAVTDIPTTSAITTAVLTTAMTESYAADGVAPTLAQALHMLLGREYEFSITGDILTVKKLDGTTTAMTFTLAPSGGPYTSITRTT